MGINKKLIQNKVLLAGLLARQREEDDSKAQSESVGENRDSENNDHTDVEEDNEFNPKVLFLN
jgi:hypothetical protein